jgi:hypothetical protein
MSLGLGDWKSRARVSLNFWNLPELEFWNSISKRSLSQLKVSMRRLLTNCVPPVDATNGSLKEISGISTRLIFLFQKLDSQGSVTARDFLQQFHKRLRGRALLNDGFHVREH